MNLKRLLTIIFTVTFVAACGGGGGGGGGGYEPAPAPTPAPSSNYAEDDFEAVTDDNETIPNWSSSYSKF